VSCQLPLAIIFLKHLSAENKNVIQLINYNNYGSFMKILSLCAIYKGATIIEKHFTLDRSWDGPDNKISILPHELKMLVDGEKVIRSMGKSVPDESDVKKFAFHSVVSTKDIKRGKMLTRDNSWVKRPGGGIPASEYENVLGMRALRDIDKDTQINYRDLVWKNI
jgi:N-acetylneuraminate synthase